MKLTIKTETLQGALATTQPALNSSGQDISGHYLFRVKDDTAEVLTFSGRLFASCPLETTSLDTTGADAPMFTVEGKRLQQWLSAVNSEEVSLTFKGDGQVVATSTRGEVILLSLDPSSFPFWDDVLAKVEEDDIHVVDGARFSGALKHLGSFVSSDDTKNPNICVAEVSHEDDSGERGAFKATNHVSLTKVDVAGLNKSTLRIHGQDISSLVRFLSKVKENVQIYEHEYSMFVVRPDGGLFGWSRFSKGLPAIRLGKLDSTSFVWKVKPEDVLSAVQFLLAGAAKEQRDVHLKVEDGDPVLSMPAAYASGMTTVQLDGQSTEPEEDDSDGAKLMAMLVKDGVRVRIDPLQKMMGSWQEEEITLRFFFRNPSGFCMAEEERDGDSYLVVLPFVR